VFDEDMTTVTTSNAATLRELAPWTATPLVSVYIPLDFGRPQSAHTIERALRQAAQAASAKLANDYGLDQAAVEAFLAPLVDEQVLADVPTSARSLAVFLSWERSHHLSVRSELGTTVEIGDRPDLLPLLASMNGDTDYYCLTIDKKGAELFRGSHFAFEPVVVPGMPGSIGDALWYIRREPMLERTASGMAYSSGSGKDLRKDDVRQFLHLIDQAIAPTLNGSDAPLVVVGVEYEASMFINSTRYRHVVHQPILGNPDNLTRADIERRSWELAQAQSTGAADVVAHFNELAGTGKTSCDPHEVANASEQGFVRHLLIAESAASTASTLTPDDHRTVVTAVNECLRHHADVHIIDDTMLPTGTHIAAILRY
jgi:Bacterial archaeo-eukaryotic release factor family 3